MAGTHLEEWNRLCKSLHKNPVDADGWLRLIELTEQFGNVETTKEVLERLLTIYPHNVSPLHFDCSVLINGICIVACTLQPYAQTAYLQHYLTDRGFGNPEPLFDRFMRIGHCSVSVALLYMSHIK